jgi:hypothetical protein
VHSIPLPPRASQVSGRDLVLTGGSLICEDTFNRIKASVDLGSNTKCSAERCSEIRFPEKWSLTMQVHVRRSSSCFRSVELPCSRSLGLSWGGQHHPIARGSSRWGCMLLGALLRSSSLVLLRCWAVPLDKKVVSQIHRYPEVDRTAIAYCRNADLEDSVWCMYVALHTTGYEVGFCSKPVRISSLHKHYAYICSCTFKLYWWFVYVVPYLQFVSDL